MDVSCRRLCTVKEKRNVDADSDQAIQENVENVGCPTTLSLPSQTFIDDLTKEQYKHYQAILHQYETRLSTDPSLKVPSVMTDNVWRKLLARGTSKMAKILLESYAKEKKKEAKRMKKKEIQLDGEGRMADENTFHRNTFLGQLTMMSRSKWYLQRAYQAMRFGPKLVFDFGYKEELSYHSIREQCRLSPQIRELAHYNSKESHPFHLVFCNVDDKTRIWLEEAIGTVPVTMTRKNYLDLFPASELVYLSPDSDNDLPGYCPDDVYIVGCITDLITKPKSRQKARKHRIRHAKFPIKRYLGKEDIKTTLTLNQVHAILMELKGDSTWIKALEHVPKRFSVVKSPKGQSNRHRDTEELRSWETESTH